MIFIKQLSRYDFKCKLRCRTIFVNFCWVVDSLHTKQLQKCSCVKIYIWSHLHNYYQISPSFWQVVPKSCGILIIQIYNPVSKHNLYEGTTSIGACFFWDTQYCIFNIRCLNKNWFRKTQNAIQNFTHFQIQISVFLSITLIWKGMAIWLVSFWLVKSKINRGRYILAS